MRVPSYQRLTLLALLAGCSDPKPRDYGDPTSLSVPSDQSGLVAWMVAPQVTRALTTATPDVVFGAYTKDKPYQALTVLVGRLEKDADGVDQSVDMRPAEAQGDPGPDQRFKLQVPLIHGTNRLIARITSADQTVVRRIAFALEYDGSEPGLSLSVRAPTDAALAAGKPCSATTDLTAAVTSRTKVCVSGRVTSKNHDHVSVSLGLSGFERSSPTVAKDGTFELALELATNRSNVIEAELMDSNGQKTSAQIEVVQDSKPPFLEVTSLARQTSASSLEISGDASDPYGIAAVEIHGEDDAVISLGAGTSWKTDLPLSYGVNNVSVVARDLAGNEATLPLSLERLRTLYLGDPKRDAGATQIELDKLKLQELLTEDNQKSLSMVQVDMRPAIKQALEQIREPERFGVDTSSWGVPEHNLQHILEMTPDTADLSGTSVEQLLSIANAVGLPSPRMLAQLMNLGVTDFILDADVATQVLTDQVIGTHPNISHDANGVVVMDVSLYDVMQDLSTIAPRFGPSGAHPGFLAGQSYSEVLEPGFLLSIPVSSNLVQYDAVDLTKASKDYLFLVDGDRVLDFDTLSDDFTVVGLSDEPTVDLRITLREEPGTSMLKGGTVQDANPDPTRPGFYRGNGQGWGMSPWFFENVAVDIGYRMFVDDYASESYQHTLHYDAGSIKDAAVVDWDKGWLTITTAGGVGAPPAPIYVWDLLMEVAQVRLHDNGLPEGEAEMAFSLNDLSIGLTADQLIAKLRPRLAEQQQKLSEFLVGDYGLAAPHAEFFYIPAKNQVGALAFRAAGDAEGTYPYRKPGFYSDETLSKKVSSTAATGGVTETKHEKVPAKVGAVYFAADESGRVYRIEIVERTGTEIGLRVSEAGSVQ